MTAEKETTAKAETAQAVFDRINRRRRRLEAELAATTLPMPSAPVTAPADAPVGTGPADAVGVVTPLPGAGDPLRMDEVLYPGSLPPRQDADTFPRSATMRFILRNPTLALGVGVPAAVLVLRSQATRRMLRLALEVGTRPAVQDLIGLSVTSLRLMQSREQPQDSATTAASDETQKKAP